MLNGGKLPVAADNVTVAEVLIAYLRFARGYYVKNRESTNEVAMLIRVMGILHQLCLRERVATYHRALTLRLVCN
jgi:hypothetical protein